MSPLAPGSTQYDRLNHRTLAQAGGIGVDLHFHTRYSDGTARVRDAVRRAARFGIGLAITDHNEVRGALEAQRLSEGKVFLVPAIEVNCAEGCDLLVYFASYRDLIRFYEDEVAPYRGMNPIGRLHRGLLAVAEGATTHGGVVSAAHPFGVFGNKNLHRWTMRNGRKLLDYVAAIETNNATMTRRANDAAHGWADELHKARTGGSDGHTLSELGRVGTWTPQVRTAGQFLEAVASGEGAVVGARATALSWATSSLQIARRHALYAVPGLRSLVRTIDRRARLARTAILASHPWVARLLEELEPEAEFDPVTQGAPLTGIAGAGQ